MFDMNVKRVTIMFARRLALLGEREEYLKEGEM